MFVTEDASRYIQACEMARKDNPHSAKRADMESREGERRKGVIWGNTLVWDTSSYHSDGYCTWIRLRCFSEVA